jgi:hypothetical protein
MQQLVETVRMGGPLCVRVAGRAAQVFDPFAPQVFDPFAPQVFDPFAPQVFPA